MKPRYLNILILGLYILAALSMLGVGVNREKLKELRQQEQNLEEENIKQRPFREAEQAPTSTTVEQELQDKLTLWQLIALGLFGTASLLLVLKDKLVKKPSAP